MLRVVDCLSQSPLRIRPQPLPRLGSSAFIEEKLTHSRQKYAYRADDDKQNLESFPQVILKIHSGVQY
jgi:hypothetical protein